MPVVSSSNQLVPERIQRCRPTDIRAKGQATAQHSSRFTARTLAAARAKTEAFRAGIAALRLRCPQTCREPYRCQHVNVKDYGSGLTFGGFRRVRNAAGNLVWQITAYAFEVIHHECRCRRS